MISSEKINILVKMQPFLEVGEFLLRLATFWKEATVFYFYLATLVKTVALTRAPENVGENHDIRFEAPFTLSLAGHIDMLFFRCFRL